ncbi:MAG: hypothetical protein ACN4G0_20140 [Polyangiales bacterium]
MLLLASCVAAVTLVSSGGCITTTPIEFEAAQNYPPSVVSEPTAEFPLNRIGRLDLDVPVDAPEMPLEVIVRDPNLDQTLVYRMFLDSPPAPDIPFTADEITPSGFVERPTVLFVPYDRLTAGECHRIELVVTGQFANFVTRRPEEEGDFDDATWWVEVVDADNPVITEDCR